MCGSSLQQLRKSAEWTGFVENEQNTNYAGHSQSSLMEHHALNPENSKWETLSQLVLTMAQWLKNKPK